MFFGSRRQFGDVIPFDQIKTRVVIENHLCFAVLKYCGNSSVAGSKPVLTRASAVTNSSLLSWKPGLNLVI
jgi:hypothetical protein